MLTASGLLSLPSLGRTDGARDDRMTVADGAPTSSDQLSIISERAFGRRKAGWEPSLVCCSPFRRSCLPSSLDVVSSSSCPASGLPGGFPATCSVALLLTAPVLVAPATRCCRSLCAFMASSRFRILSARLMGPRLLGAAAAAGRPEGDGPSAGRASISCITSSGMPSVLAIAAAVAYSRCPLEITVVLLTSFLSAIVRHIHT
mmetsp:Transcript_14804/g.32190  ORF Transcript_14804/g.32190 Transcript_14804/m.32190 type:complete len:203 (+) Transcript_14804:765-1373(+)